VSQVYSAGECLCTTHLFISGHKSDNSRRRDNLQDSDLSQIPAEFSGCLELLKVFFEFSRFVGLTAAFQFDFDDAHNDRYYDGKDDHYVHKAHEASQGMQGTVPHSRIQSALYNRLLLWYKRGAGNFYNREEEKATEMREALEFGLRAVRMDTERRLPRCCCDKRCLSQGG